MHLFYVDGLLPKLKSKLLLLQCLKKELLFHVSLFEQGQASKWIKNMERDSNLCVIKYTDPDYLTALQGAIQVNT